MTFSIRIHGQKFFKTHFQFPNHQASQLIVEIGVAKTGVTIDSVSQTEP